MSRAEDTARSAAREVQRAFGEFFARFAALTARAPARFAARDWPGHQADARLRLAIYPQVVQELAARLAQALGARAHERPLWADIKRHYAALVAHDDTIELARTFFNSVGRKTFGTVGVDADTEFLPAESSMRLPDPGRSPVRRYDARAGTRSWLRSVLADAPLAAPFRDLDAAADLAAAKLTGLLAPVLGLQPIQEVEILEPIFYRSKGAYLIGRLRVRNRLLPLVLPLVSEEGGIEVDAVLVDASEVSILFSFTRSYFHVAAGCPRDLVLFLRSIMPLKPLAELYSALGFDKHGKTELYRSLERQLAVSPERFEIAPGDRGLVMLVFSLPHYDRVFKVIRDVFAYPKSTSAREVRERYTLVFERDRVGRLVEAQEFEQLQFDRDRFSEPLLAELLASASQSVLPDGERLSILHLYTERKVRPLNLYVREAKPEAVRRAVIDYGHAIKELAAANIFPGDFLLKNFGVTRHGRVVFYDYDELCLLTDCAFRELPVPRSPEDELASEPWFTVRENDVFPQEFRSFLDLDAALLAVFEQQHADLFTVEFWRGMQERHRRGELMDFFPYPQSRRLARPSGAGLRGG